MIRFMILTISLFIIVYLNIVTFTYVNAKPKFLQLADADSEITPNPFNAKEYDFVTEWGKEISDDEYIYHKYENGIYGKFSEGAISIALDRKSNVYITDTFMECIQKFDSNGTFLSAWDRWDWKNGLAGEGIDYWRGPTGIAIDCKDNIYIIDSLRCNIWKLNTNYIYIANQWGKKGSGSGRFMTIDKLSNIYISDEKNNRIQKFDSNGNFITMWGKSGNNNGEFNFPLAIAVDRKSNVYVVDCNNNRIQKFDSNGNFITKWNGEGARCGLTIDMADNIYTTCGMKNCIRKTDSNGNFITQWGSEGTGDGQFKFPTGMAVDCQGNVYVIDNGNFRIQKFEPKL